MTTTKTPRGLDGLVKREVIERVVARTVAEKWAIRSAVEEATAWLQRSERARRRDVEEYVRAAFAAAASPSD